MPPDDLTLGAGVRPMTAPPVGQRERWRYNANGGIDHEVWNDQLGRYTPASPSTISPEFATRLADTSRDLETDSNAVNFGRQFLQFNQRQRTGDPWHWLPGGLGTMGDPELAAMSQIQNRFVRSNIQRGTSGAGNTGPEQIRIERSGPAISNPGPANRAIVLNLQIDRDLRVMEQQAAAEWARDPSRGSYQDFDAWWAQNRDRFRDQIQRRYEATNGPVTRQADAFGRQRPNPTQQQQRDPFNIRHLLNR